MSRNNELLLNNALDEDFQQMLRPYYWTKRLLCASKYSIKDNFVLPNWRAGRLHLPNENDLRKAIEDVCGTCKEILKAYSLFSYLVQYQVLSYVVSTFTDNLITVQTVIEWTKNSKTPEVYKNVSYTYVLKFMRNIKNFSFVVLFSAACERFYRRVDRIRNDCAVALDEHPEGGKTILIRKLLRRY
ncbi:hypothetical protein EVAR_51139_1 [Eumeta japonica]|uniref:Uncharacterized protein n=1 Tax=Eumeta variegata TaxID=151549 RepID=A0A4C1YP40_EUMVA|nr:hypothetical protein EVAR_51139_1 [Eumeta japonica]